MSKQGYIKLYRQIQDCWVWELPGPFDERSAWIDLLMSANHDDHKTMFDGQLIVVKRGQWITSVRKLADRWRWGNQKTLKFLRALEEDGMIDRDANSRRTLITIANYEKFQGSDNGSGTLNGTLNGTVPEHCSTTNKNSKNEKNDKNNNPPISPLENSGLSEPVKAEMEKWLKYKKERKESYKPMGLQSLLTQVRGKEQEYGIQPVVDVIELSMSNQWRGIIWDKIKAADKKEVDDGLGIMERMYYANGNRYEGPNYFARRDEA